VRKNGLDETYELRPTFGSDYVSTDHNHDNYNNSYNDYYNNCNNANSNGTHYGSGIANFNCANDGFAAHRCFDYDYHDDVLPSTDVHPASDCNYDSANTTNNSNDDNDDNANNNNKIVPCYDLPSSPSTGSQWTGHGAFQATSRQCSTDRRYLTRR